MRRLLVFAVTLVAVLGILAPPVMAQAPAPKVTITGFIDNLGTYTRNMSIYDLDYNRANDVNVYGRTRGRFDIIGEVGKAKAVFGFELDMYYGQTGNQDNNFQPGSNATSAGAGADGGFDLNTDSRTIMELKWLYTEFPLPIPLPTTVRLGAQPFSTLANDKLAVYANGDFPGVAFIFDITPAAKLNLTYVQVEESLTGGKDGFIRGEDWAVIASFGFSPFKGFDIKPMYSFFQAKGPTSANARQGRGGVDTSAAFSTGGFTTPQPITATTAPGTITTVNSYSGPTENRHTIGLDARFTAGPISVQPTVMYQFGNRHNIITNAAYGAVGTLEKADISAWLADVRVGFNVGPLSLGVMGMFTSGQDAKSNPFKTVDFYQPLDTDTSYMGDWGTQIFSLGIDYFNILFSQAGGLNPGTAIGYDKYGRMGGGAKVAYALTPAFTVGAGVAAFWTQYKVDTDSTLSTTSGLTPNFIGGRPKGDSQYLGTELNLSGTYVFAPGLAFDVAGGYLFAGDALSHNSTAGCCNGAQGTTFRGGKDGVDNVLIGTARVRFSF